MFVLADILPQRKGEWIFIHEHIEYHSNRWHWWNAWCEENCDSEFRFEYWSPNKKISALVFDEPTDAMAFKLRWL